MVWMSSWRKPQARWSPVEWNQKLQGLNLCLQRMEALLLQMWQWLRIVTEKWSWGSHFGEKILYSVDLQRFFQALHLLAASKPVRNKQGDFDHFPFKDVYTNVHWLILTAAIADCCKMTKKLVMKRNHFGTKGFPSSKKLPRMRPSDWLPNAQYPEIATLKKVTPSTA